MTVLKPRTPPPPDYYRNNFQAVIDFIQAHHAPSLREADCQWIRQWTEAGLDAQRLLVRLLMRKGPWIRTDKLVYGEVPRVDDALDALVHLALATIDEPAPADRLLDLLTLGELPDLFPTTARRFRPRKKEQWMHALLSGYPDDSLRGRISRQIHWVRLCGGETLARLQLLYFGSPVADLSAFVLRDLGFIRYEPLPLDTLASGLLAPGVLDRYRELCNLEGWFPALDSIDGLAESLRQHLRQPVPFRAADRRRSRLLNSLGLWHERRGETARALACYEDSQRHPARERRVRLLSRQKRQLEAESLLIEMATESWCVEEEIFVQRFGRRGMTDDTPASTRRLSGPPPPAVPGAIEAHALAVLAAEGAFGFHLENVLPLMLTGLAYWEVVFAPVPGAFTHPFQSAPHDLWWDDFAAPRKELIQSAREALERHPDPAAHVLATRDAKEGVACDLVHWRALDVADLARILAVMPATMLRALVNIVIDNPGRCRTGFPDLFVAWPDGRCEFIEVKGPNDQLQPQQRVWLKRLADHGIPARVLKFRRPEPAACAS